LKYNILSPLALGINLKRFLRVVKLFNIKFKESGKSQDLRKINFPKTQPKT